jgi:hypothetical protein
MTRSGNTVALHIDRNKHNITDSAFETGLELSQESAQFHPTFGKIVGWNNVKIVIVKHDEAADLLMSVAFGNRVEIWGNLANLGRGSIQIGSIYKRICCLSERQAIVVRFR